MRKSVLVIDSPETCNDCPCVGIIQGSVELWCYAVYKPLDVCGTKEPPTWCPLVALPERRNNTMFCTTAEFIHNKGFNACLDEITGGED